ncbi:MAG: hypothetical protein ABEJ82_09990 [Haloplanus sp.]
MVPDSPSLTRRRLLGAVGAVGGGTLAVGATAPTALPDWVTDRATQVYPTPPEIQSHWRPTVTEGHAREAVESLATVVSEGRRLWKRLDTDDDFLGAGGWLESAREDLRKDDYHEALFDATYGMQFAGEDLGTARARLDREAAALPTLTDRATALLDRSDRVAADLDPYPVADPGLDLAWYYRVERELVFGRFAARWSGMDDARNGVDDEDGPDASAYDPRRIGSITGSLLQGEMRVRNAERYRDLLADRVGGADADDYGDHLRDVRTSFRRDVDAFPPYGEVRSRYVGEDDHTTPYQFAHWRLVRWCFDSNYRFGADVSDDLSVYRAVELSRGLAQRRAHDFAVAHLVVDRDDEGFDSGHALAEKRRARRVYRRVVGADPPALLTRQASRAIEDLQVAKVGFAGDYQRPLWRERLKAYIYALVGRAKLRQYPAVYDAVVTR